MLLKSNRKSKIELTHRMSSQKITSFSKSKQFQSHKRIQSTQINNDSSRMSEAQINYMKPNNSLKIINDALTIKDEGLKQQMLRKGNDNFKNNICNYQYDSLIDSIKLGYRKKLKLQNASKCRELENTFDQETEYTLRENIQKIKHQVDTLNSKMKSNTINKIRVLLRQLEIEAANYHCKNNTGQSDKENKITSFSQQTQSSQIIEIQRVMTKAGEQRHRRLEKKILNNIQI